MRLVIEQEVLKTCLQRTNSQEKTSGREMHNALATSVCDFLGKPQLSQVPCAGRLGTGAVSS